MTLIEYPVMLTLVEYPVLLTHGIACNANTLVKQVVMKKQRLRQVRINNGSPRAQCEVLGFNIFIDIL